MTIGENENDILKTACENLGTLLEPERKKIVRNPLQPFSSLHAAFDHLGKQLQFSFIFPPDTLQKEALEDRIDRIARASEVDYRSIDLKSIFGVVSPVPLLAFYGDDKKPVVIKLNKSGCALYDPVNDRWNQLGVDQIENFAPLVYEFYRPIGVDASPGFFNVLKKMLSYHKHEAIVALASGFLFTLASLFFPFAIKILFDTVMRSGDVSFLFQLSTGLAAVLISSAMFSLVQRYTVSRLRTMIQHDLQLGLWGKVFRSSSKILKKFTVGEIFEKINYFSRSQQTLGENAITAVINAFYAIFYLGVMLYFSLQFSLGVIAIVAISFLFSYFFMKYFIKLERIFLPLENKLVSKVVQFIRGIATIRASDSEDRFFASWTNSFIPTQQLLMRMGITKTWFTSLIRSTPMIITLMVYIVAVIRLEQGETSIFSMTIGDYIAFVYALNSFVQATFGAYSYYFELMAIVPTWNQAQEVLNFPPESKFVAPSRTTLSGNIHLENVHFAYSEERPLLKGINLNVKQGEFIGIVGPTGCGKSSLLRLLMGLEVPTRGNVYYDGRDLSEWDLKDLRSQIGCVLQNSTIFAGSILENITVGRRISKEKLEEVVNAAGLSAFIAELPMGLLTMLSYGGSTISMGQKQRILIARALVDDPKLILFDEATSALDNQTQQVVSHNLSNLKVTRIVVAHRPAALMSANRVYLLEEGILKQKPL